MAAISRRRTRCAMCYDHDSHPPIDPISGGALDASRISLTSEASDHTRFLAYLARPAKPTGAGILILPDVRGLHHFFEELALRFAEHGTTALAIDYFARTADTDDRGPDFEYMPHVSKARWEGLSGEIRAGVAHLRSLDPAPRSIFATGFCMGGRLASMAATLGLGLAGVIPFYGWPVGPNRNGTPAPAENADKIECDVLAFYGGTDEGIPKETIEEYDAALDKAKVRHETVVYPRAPHSFFDKKQADYQTEAADAWAKTQAFIRRHTMGQPFAAAAPAPAPDAPETSSGPDSVDARISHWTDKDA